MLEWNYTYISSITNDEFTRYYLLMNNEKQKKLRHIRILMIRKEQSPGKF